MNEKFAEKGVEFLETAIKLAQNEGPKLLSEFMNYMTFQIALSVLQNMMWGALVFFIIKGVNVFISGLKSDLDLYQGGKQSDENVQKANKLKSNIAILITLRSLAVVVTGLILLSVSIPQVKLIGKIVLAPKLFLIEEGANLLKKGK